MVNYNFSFFMGLRRGIVRSFQVELYYSIQVKSKLDVRVQSVTKIIVYGAKLAIKRFMAQNVIDGIV